MILRKTATHTMAGKRLDEAVSFLCENMSRSEARRIIDRGGCSLNGSMVRVASRALRAEDIIEIGVMEPGRFRELKLSDDAILFEDTSLVAVNKPAGVNTQRTPYQLKGTLEYGVGEYFRGRGINEPVRVIHRLDRGTSGVTLFPKNRRTAAGLSRLFHDGLIDKRYFAVVSGPHRPESWIVNGAIGKTGAGRYGIVTGGRPARTIFHPLETVGRYSLVEARPLTGRTHQIRVHLAASDLPIVGDTVYGGETADRMMLHCAALLFVYGANVPTCVSAPPDTLFEAFLREKDFTWEYKRWRDIRPGRSAIPGNGREMPSDNPLFQ